jgi:superfamily I DNA/RNA helicase
VKDALSAYARRMGQDIKTVNPLVALGDPSFQSVLAEKLVKVRGGFKFDKAVEKLEEIQAAIAEMQANSESTTYTTKDMFDDILAMRGTAAVTNPITGRAQFVDQTFRESLKAEIRDKMDDEESIDDDADSSEGLGNVSFLYELAKKDPTDPGDLISDPNSPHGFKNKMERYSQRARELRIDISKWDKEQEALPPEDRKPPPGVYLGTCHSTKGAQWKSVYVQMPKGKFPFEPPAKPGEPPPPPNPEELEAERRLGYVALTRAAMNLTVVCPKSVGGRAAGISPFVIEAGLELPKSKSNPPSQPGEVGPDLVETFRQALRDQGRSEAEIEQAVRDELKVMHDESVRSASDEYEGVIPDEWKVN